jgi:hypothetical protein
MSVGLSREPEAFGAAQFMDDHVSPIRPPIAYAVGFSEAKSSRQVATSCIARWNDAQQQAFPCLKKGVRERGIEKTTAHGRRVNGHVRLY